jgi:hypothetical protein
MMVEFGQGVFGVVLAAASLRVLLTSPADPAAGRRFLLPVSLGLAGVVGTVHLALWVVANLAQTGPYSARAAYLHPWQELAAVLAAVAVVVSLFGRGPSAWRARAVAALSIVGAAFFAHLV